jgi:cardiolipin synthase
MITVLRVIMVVPVGYLLLHERYGEALLLFAVAGLSDALDGYLAKRNGWTSWLGAVLDPLADKFLLMVSFLALGMLKLLPVWLVALVIARDVIIVAGATAYHFLIARTSADPTLLSKLNTFAQIVLVLCVVAEQAFARDWHALIRAMIFVVLATTLASGLAYVLGWTLRAIRTAKGRTA